MKKNEKEYNNRTRDIFNRHVVYSDYNLVFFRGIDKILAVGRVIGNPPSFVCKYCQNNFYSIPDFEHHECIKLLHSKRTTQTNIKKVVT